MDTDDSIILKYHLEICTFGISFMGIGGGLAQALFFRRDDILHDNSYIYISLLFFLACICG